MSDWKSRAKPVTTGSWKERATPVQGKGIDPEANLGIGASPAADVVGKGLEKLSDLVVTGVDSIPGVGYLKKAQAAIAAPIKGQTYDETVSGYNQDIKERAERNPGEALTGSLLFGSAAPVSSASSALGRITQNTAVNALDAAGRGSSGIDTDNMTSAAAITALLSSGMEAGPLLAKLKPLLGKASDVTEDFARAKAVKSLDPILSQQEMLDRKGLTNKLGKELLDSKTVNYGDSVDNMLPKVEKMLDLKGQQLGELRKLADEGGATVNLGELTDYVQQTQAKTKGMSQSTKDVADRLSKQFENVMEVPTRNVSQTADLLSSLGQDARFNKVSAPAAAEAARDIYGKIRSLGDEAAANVSPKLAADIADAREMFSLYKNGEEILDKATARQARNSTFGLRDVILAAPATSTDGMWSAAVALASKLARERGNATMAAGARDLATALKKASETNGQLPPEIQQMVMQAVRSGYLK